MDKFYTVPEVAELLKISQSKMYRLVQRGSIPHVKIGRNVRISESDLKDWLQALRTDHSSILELENAYVLFKQ